MPRTATLSVVSILFAAGAAHAQADNYVYEGRVTEIVSDELGLFSSLEVGSVARGTFGFQPQTAVLISSPQLDIEFFDAVGVVTTIAGEDYTPANVAAGLAVNDTDIDLSGFYLNGVSFYDSATAFDGVDEDMIAIGGEIFEFVIGGPSSDTFGSITNLLIGPSDTFQSATDASGTVFALDRLTSAGVSIEFAQVDPNADPNDPNDDGVLFSQVVIDFVDLSFASGGSIVTFGSLADMNEDERFTFNDIVSFINAFQSQSLTADFNADGLFTISDINAFLNRFVAGS